MRSLRLATVLILTLGGVALADDARERGAKKGANECVEVTTEARFRNYAYDHIVNLDNGCDSAVRCRVSTDVNPEPSTVQLAKGEKKSILTFRGSPAREFQVATDCAYKR